MKNKTVSVKKIDVQNLSNEQLALLIDLKSNPVYKVLETLAQDYKVRRAFESLESNNLDEIRVLSGANIGVGFIMDSVERAKEELNDRGSNEIIEEKVDNEEIIK